MIVAEKAPVLGGATAWSGGWMWAPLNPLSQADGIVEDIDAPRTYLKHALGENYDEPRVEALLQNARHMVAFFEKHTSLQFVSGTWIADIQGDLPGAGTGGRSVGPKPYQRPQAAQGPARAGPPAAVRDVVPRHGHHGRPGPAGVPARHPVAAVVRARRLAGRVPRCST